MPQLAATGLERDRVHYRVRTGRLHRIHRGVYAVGHRALSNEARWMAAVLACGDGALLSHGSAAALWRLLPVRPGPVDVTIPASAGRKKRRSIHLHRSPSVISASTRRSGIPVTTPDRTIADLRSKVPAHQLRRAIREAGVLGLSLNDAVGPVPTRSELEHQFLRSAAATACPCPRSTPG
jgi:predicted transcriptional regulator of viral defense system